jgi:hypothetical protein
MRVSGDDGLSQKVIEPYEAPLLPMIPLSALRKPAMQLKLVLPGMVPSGSARNELLQASDSSWSTVLSGRKPTAPSVKPAWGVTVIDQPVAPPARPINPRGPDACEIPDLRSFRSPAVQPPESSSVTTKKGPESFTGASETAADDSISGNAAVSQKKAKKHELEARRKAKKTVVQDDVAAALNVTTKNCDTIVEPDRPSDLNAPLETVDELGTLPPKAFLNEAAVDFATTLVADESAPWVAPAQTRPLQPFRTMYNNKHTHWTRFERQFTVDQLTDPFFSIDSGCTHSKTCVYEMNDEIDCPYHKPRNLIIDLFFVKIIC